MATIPSVNVESMSTPEDEPTEPLASMATIPTTSVESVSTPENDMPTPKRRKRKKAAYNTDGLYVTIDGVNPAGKQLYYNAPSTTEPSRILFTLAVPNRLLYYWYKNRSANNLLNVINTKIVGSAIRLKPGIERTQSRLMEQASRISRRVTKASGRKRENLLEQFYHIFVLQDEAESFDEMVNEIARGEEQITTLLEEMATILVSRSENDINVANTDTTASPTFINKGKTIEEVSPRQGQRKLAKYKTFAQSALWFSESFGLVPEYILLHKSISKSPVKVTFNATDDNTQQPSGHDFEKVMQVLYILDRFAVSDEAYHEIRMSSKQSDSTSTLPPLYQVKNSRRALNSTIEIERFQGGYPGAFRPLLGLLQREISRMVMTTVAGRMCS